MDVCDLLSLSVGDLDKMRIEFPDVYEELFTDGKGRLKEELKMKKVMIRTCIKEANQLGSRFALMFMKQATSESDSDEDDMGHTVKRAPSIQKQKTRN